MSRLDLDELNASLIELQSERESIQKEIDSFDVSEYISYEEYDEFLDDIYGTVDVAGLVFNPSTILKELDKTAYRCGFLDYCSSYDVDNVPEYRNLTERLDELESEISDTEGEIEELQEED